jgi:hypothetical protein
MTEITKRSYYISPTVRVVDGDGRLTKQGFDIFKAAAELVEAVTVVEGEITTAMLADLAVQASKLDNGAVVIGKLAAGSIHVSTLFADEVVITSKVATNAVSVLGYSQTLTDQTAGNSFVKIAETTVTTDGGAVLVAAFHMGETGFGDNDQEIDIRKNGTSIFTAAGSHLLNSGGNANKGWGTTYAVRDNSPGVGSVTYSYWFRNSDDADTIHARAATIFVQNAKK